MQWDGKVFDPVVLIKALKGPKGPITHDRSGLIWGIVLRLRSCTMQRKDQVLDPVGPYQGP